MLGRVTTQPMQFEQGGLTFEEKLHNYARLAVRVGARVIRPVLVAMSLARASRLLWQAWSA